jgi:DNA-binding Xre family transcriptional regulator
MIHAYNKIYLANVMQNLAGLFDIAINAEEIQPDDIGSLFVGSSVACAIESGNPNYLSGKSATEMLAEVLQRQVTYTQIPLDRTPEFWAGWVLAYTQWYLDRTFQEILNVIPFSAIISLYHPYHEATEIKTAQRIQSLFPNESPLKRYRKLRALTQKQLSEISGINIRNICAYEQDNVKLHNAGGETLLALAKALDCTIEELLK